MTNMRMAGVLLSSLGIASAVWAQTGSVKLVSPADGATLDPREPIQVAYEVVTGPKVDHIHLYVDGKEVAVLRGAKGSHALETLASGSREICIKAVTKAHVPTGLEQCIQVKVK